MGGEAYEQARLDGPHTVPSPAASLGEQYWMPVKPEPRWVKYVSDGRYTTESMRREHESAEPLDLLPAEGDDLPDLEFPVPAQDVIPEMVLENDAMAATPAPQGDDSDAKGSNCLIPIQGSIVAHSRSGKPSVAAVAERRAKNTEAARRSRARRADKLYELRERNEELSKRNVALISENERLRGLVRALEHKMRLAEE